MTLSSGGVLAIDTVGTDAEIYIEAAAKTITGGNDALNQSRCQRISHRIRFRGNSCNRFCIIFKILLHQEQLRLLVQAELWQ